MEFNGFFIQNLTENALQNNLPNFISHFQEAAFQFSWGIIWLQFLVDNIIQLLTFSWTAALWLYFFWFWLTWEFFWGQQTQTAEKKLIATSLG